MTKASSHQPATFSSVSTPRGSFAVRQCGDHGPLVVLVHGFPDDASTWDQVTIDLVSAGYRTAAVNLRGYAPSPLNGDLGLEGLVQDLIQVIEALSPSASVSLVAHDYGAQLAYRALALAPGRFQAAVLLSGAHPAVVQRNARRSAKQLWMSRYIVLFQLGRLADRAVARRDFAYVRRLWRRWSPGFAMPEEHARRVLETLRASMPAPVAMYRAGGFDTIAEPISVPTLYLTGGSDGCALPFLADGQETLFSGPYAAETWPDVGHFPQLEQPSRVAEAVRAWLGTHGGPRTEVMS